jgi:hypothetical protein
MWHEIDPALFLFWNIYLQYSHAEFNLKVETGNARADVGLSTFGKFAPYYRRTPAAKALDRSLGGPVLKINKRINSWH